MTDQHLTIDQIKVPRMLYGTAWKEAETERLVEQALEQGFRGIDTANQRKHYDEAAVGKAIRAACDRGLIEREELFVQTKFTFLRGQDHRLPYEPNAPIETQVQQSCASSLDHLGIDRIDSYILHGPSTAVGLAQADWEAWRAIEQLHESGRVRLLGVSNVNAGQLRLLCERARIRPHFVQNRCYAVKGWDRAVREVCAAQGITYQGFSLLTANRAALSEPLVARIASRYQRTVPQVVFRFVQQCGMLPLTGTTSVDHMREDLDLQGFQLEAEEIEQMMDLAV